MKLSDITKQGGFSLDTKSLGRLYVRGLTITNYSFLAGWLRGMSSPCPRAVVEQLLRLLASRQDFESLDDAPENAAPFESLSDDAIGRIEEEEREEFARLFLEANGWLKQQAHADEVDHDAPSHDKGHGKDSESDSPQLWQHRLERVLRAKVTAHDERIKRFLEPFKNTLGRSYLSNSTLEAFARHSDATRRLQETIAAATRPTEATRRLQDTIADAARQSAAMHISREQLQPPPSPVHDSNEILSEIQGQLEEIGNVTAEAADLLSSTSELAVGLSRDYAHNARSSSRIGKVMLVVALVALVVSAFASVLLYHQARASTAVLGELVAVLTTSANSATVTDDASLGSGRTQRDATGVPTAENTAPGLEGNARDLDTNAGEQMDSREKKALDDIEAFGCHIICVLEESDSPPFAYSIGVQRTSGVPEVIVMGLKDEIARFVINEYNRRVQAGERFRPGERYSGFLEGFEVLFEEVDPGNYEEYLGWNRWLYDGDDFRVLQLIYPTTNGIWPWDQDATEWFRARQPRLSATPGAR